MEGEGEKDFSPNLRPRLKPPVKYRLSSRRSRDTFRMLSCNRLSTPFLSLLCDSPLVRRDSPLVRRASRAARRGVILRDVTEEKCHNFYALHESRKVAIRLKRKEEYELNCVEGPRARKSKYAMTILQHLAKVDKFRLTILAKVGI